MKGVLSHAAAAGWNEDHIVAVVGVRRAYFHAEPLPKTFGELLDCYDLDTRTSCTNLQTRDSHALSLRDATLYRRLMAKLNRSPTHSLRCIERGASRFSPKDADMVKLNSGSDLCFGDRPLGRTTAGRCDQTA